MVSLTGMTLSKTEYNQSARKNNPRNCLYSAGDTKSVESDVVEEKGAEAANITEPGGVLVQSSKYAADYNHYSHYPCSGNLPYNYQLNYQKSKSGQQEGLENAPESGWTIPALPNTKVSTILYTDPTGLNHSIPSLLVQGEVKDDDNQGAK